MVYPPWESLASASPRPNFPMEDKLHNLHVDVVDPIHCSMLSVYGTSSIHKRGMLPGTFTLLGALSPNYANVQFRSF